MNDYGVKIIISVLLASGYYQLDYLLKLLIQIIEKKFFILGLQFAMMEWNECTNYSINGFDKDFGHGGKMKCSRLRIIANFCRRSL